MPSKLRNAATGEFVSVEDILDDIDSGGGTLGAAVASVAGATPAGGTGSAQGAFDTSGNRDTFIATVTELKTQFNALLASLRAADKIDT